LNFPYSPHPGILRMLAPLPQGEGLKNTSCGHGVSEISSQGLMLQALR
jgi:hypothetical protein